MGIKLSKEFGVNPSVCHCICCGKDYGVALFGTSWKNKQGKTAQAPKDVMHGLCDDCKKVIDAGGCMIIEVKDGESGDNPYRTGRLIGVSKDFRDRNNFQHSIAYMEESLFSSLFSSVFKEE